MIDKCNPEILSEREVADWLDSVGQPCFGTAEMGRDRSSSD